jgi:hypothetical protein
VSSPRFVADGPLADVLAELREYADAGRAASRAAVGRAVVELGAVAAGLTIHDGRHFYVSTYCQHALDVAESVPELDVISGTLHDECRRTCKICHAPCLCHCHGTRNRSNVVPEDPDPEGAPMGNKAGDPHPKRFGKSAQQIAAEEQQRRSDENARREAEAEQIEADDIARHPGEPGYE